MDVNSALSSENQIIGGMFGLPHLSCINQECTSYDFLQESNLYLLNARSGILILLDLLSSDRIWMPSYLCPTMVRYIDTGKVKIEYYSVDDNLREVSDDWVKKVKQGDLAVFIDYFGFLSGEGAGRGVKERGGWVLEDACQALLTQRRLSQADFVLFSPPKFVGVPDGGILSSRCEVGFDAVNLEVAPVEWWGKAFEAAMSRREFDRFGGDRQWYELYKEGKKSMPAGYYAMSELSSKLLKYGFCWPEITKKRRENFAVLQEGLCDWALFDNLKPGVTPLGYPIRVRDRDGVRQFLFQHNIYPPVHWDFRGIVPDGFEASLKLGREIMTLPCDQRYDTEDMRRMVKLVKEGMGSKR